MKRFIKVKYKIPGFHCFPGAMGKSEFLKQAHRHLFCITVTVEVKHGNRFVEFFELQDNISERFLTFPTRGYGIDFENSSCEDIAEDVGNFLIKCGFSVVEVEVDEDGENSGIVRY